ncbi:TPA: hypothetical protein ACGO92_002098 [Streptococcus suis]
MLYKKDYSMLKKAILHYKRELNEKREITVSLIHGVPKTNIEHIDLIFRKTEFKHFLGFHKLEEQRRDSKYYFKFRVRENRPLHPILSALTRSPRYTSADIQNRLSVISNLNQILMNENKRIAIYKVREMPTWSEIKDADYIFDLTSEKTEDIILNNNEKILLFLKKDTTNLNPCAYIPLSIIITTSDYTSMQHEKIIVSYESKLLERSSFVVDRFINSIRPKMNY